MDQRAIINLSVDKVNIQLLSRLKPVISIATLFFEWLIIVFSVFFHHYFPNPVIYLLVWVLIGSRMYALYSLLHDGMHYLLLPDRKLNDWICRLFLAWPLFLCLRKIRKAHLAHHLYLKTDMDPEAGHLKYSEFQFPKPVSKLILTFVRDLLGINYCKYFLLKLKNKILSPKTLSESSSAISDDGTLIIKLVKIIYYTIIGASILYMGWELDFLLYWVIPYMTIFQALNRLRLSTEHFYIPDDKIFQTRTVRLNIVERFLLSPHNLGLHAEHHLYPSVPFYYLGILHETLKASQEYEKNIVINKSYFEVIKSYIK